MRRVLGGRARFGTILSASFDCIESTTCGSGLDRKKGPLSPDFGLVCRSGGFVLSCLAASCCRSAMPRQKAPEKMTVEEELQSLLKWAERMGLENVAAALRRVVTKLPNKGSSGGAG